MISAKAMAGALLGAVLVSAACSSSLPVVPPACNTDPFACPAGQTCWVAGNYGNYTCLPSGSAPLGGACKNTPGAPTCSDGLDCFQQSEADGTCVAYCDGAHGCPDGTLCDEAQVPGSTNEIHLCMPASITGADGGVSDAAEGG